MQIKQQWRVFTQITWPRIKCWQRSRPWKAAAFFFVKNFYLARRKLLTVNDADIFVNIFQWHIQLLFGVLLFSLTRVPIFLIIYSEMNFFPLINRLAIKKEKRPIPQGAATIILLSPCCRCFWPCPYPVPAPIYGHLCAFHWYVAIRFFSPVCFLQNCVQSSSIELAIILTIEIMIMNVIFQLLIIIFNDDW